MRIDARTFERGTLKSGYKLANTTRRVLFKVDPYISIANNLRVARAIGDTFRVYISRASQSQTSSLFERRHCGNISSLRVHLYASHVLDEIERMDS